MIMHDMYVLAFVGLAISGATDWLDGYVARRMGINSVLGSYLVPLADKVLIRFVALAMVDKNLLHPGLVVLIVLRDVALVGGAVYERSKPHELGEKMRIWINDASLGFAASKEFQITLQVKSFYLCTFLFYLNFIFWFSGFRPFFFNKLSASELDDDEE